MKKGRWGPPLDLEISPGERDEHQRVLQALALVQGDHLDQPLVALEAQLPRPLDFAPGAPIGSYPVECVLDEIAEAVLVVEPDILFELDFGLGLGLLGLGLELVDLRALAAHHHRTGRGSFCPGLKDLKILS